MTIEIRTSGTADKEELAQQLEIEAEDESSHETLAPMVGLKLQRPDEQWHKLGYPMPHFDEQSRKEMRSDFDAWYKAYQWNRERQLLR